ncbi:unnamed protein product [Penicillium pancosmium]
MHQFISPFPSLTRRQRQTSDTSSPPSSRTTSPPSSPTTTLRPFPQAANQALPNHLFNLSFHPTHQRSETEHSDSHQNHDFASTSSTTTGGPSHPGCGGLDLMEPRPVDMDLHANGRCQQIHGQAQASPPLSSPSPFSRASVGVGATERNSMQHHSSQQQSPRFVMGGIFEVMEGRA